jgi:hypothetical protein
MRKMAIVGISVLFKGHVLAKFVDHNGFAAQHGALACREQQRSATEGVS